MESRTGRKKAFFLNFSIAYDKKTKQQSVTWGIVCLLVVLRSEGEKSRSIRSLVRSCRLLAERKRFFFSLSLVFIIILADGARERLSARRREPRGHDAGARVPACRLRETRSDTDRKRSNRYRFKMLSLK